MSKENIIKACDRINNIHPETISKILCEVENKTNVSELVKDIRKFLGINSPLNRYSKEYWLSRGWSEKETWAKLKELQENIKGRTSPFSAEFWINKGYSKKEAEYKRNSIRPIRKEYWLERGYSEEESILKAKEFD